MFSKFTLGIIAIGAAYATGFDNDAVCEQSPSGHRVDSLPYFV